MEELYDDKLNNLKESLTDYYLEQIEVRLGQKKDWPSHYEMRGIIVS